MGLLIFTLVFINTKSITPISAALGRDKPSIAVVLGAAVWSDNKPSPSLAFRVEKAAELFNDGIVNNTNIKFFIGYSGWTPNQLNEEIKENSWLVTELSNNELMKRNDNVWSDTLSNLGEKYKIWTNFPENPSFN